MREGGYRSAGRVVINGGEGVGISAPRVSVATQAMEVTAVSLVQRVQSALLAVTDRVVVLRDGRVVADATHTELMTDDTDYRRVVTG